MSIARFDAFLLSITVPKDDLIIKLIRKMLNLTSGVFYLSFVCSLSRSRLQGVGIFKTSEKMSNYEEGSEQRVTQILLEDCHVRKRNTVRGCGGK